MCIEYYFKGRGKNSPYDVCNGEVDQEGYLHHVCPIPRVDLLVPDKHCNCQEEKEDADGEGDRVEAGKEVLVVLAFWWFWAVSADVVGELKHLIRLIFVVHVSIADAELVVVPEEVACVRISLVLIFYVVSMQTTIRSDSVWFCTKVGVEMQWIKSPRFGGTFKPSSHVAGWSFQNEAVLFPILFHLIVVLGPEFIREWFVLGCFSSAHLHLRIIRIFDKSGAVWTAEVDTGVILHKFGDENMTQCLMCKCLPLL